MAIYPFVSEKTGQRLHAELAKQTALLATIAGKSVRAAMLEDWENVASLVSNGLGSLVLPVASQVVTPWTDSRPENDTEHQMAWNVVHHGDGTLVSGETGKVALLQMDRCLPFDTQFSPYQAFLSAITPVPAGTYNVSMGFNWGTNVKSGKTYQFTLTHDLPAGGQLAGFYGAPDQAPGNWRVYAFSGPSVTTPTETCVVTEGSAGTSLGTFTAAGVSVPASGTPAETTVGSLRFYGLNSLHRVAYGNNRWLHSPLRQYLNAQGTGWWSPATVFDRPPAYAAYDGFLTGFSDDFLAAMQPIAQVTALNYVTDGGTSAEPAYDTTYDRVFLPSGKQHHLQPTAAYGGSAGLEGDSWEYWMRVAGTQTPLPWSTWGNEATYHPEYIQYDLAAPTTARTCFMRSADRGAGSGVSVVSASGGCYGNAAVTGYRAAAACAIGLIG